MFPTRVLYHDKETCTVTEFRMIIFNCSGGESPRLRERGRARVLWKRERTKERDYLHLLHLYLNLVYQYFHQKMRVHCACACRDKGYGLASTVLQPIFLHSSLHNNEPTPARKRPAVISRTWSLHATISKHVHHICLRPENDSYIWDSEWEKRACVCGGVGRLTQRL